MALKRNLSTPEHRDFWRVVDETCERAEKYFGEHWDIITQLKADLAKFGGHTVECPLSDIKQATKGPANLNRRCDCGYEKAKERWG